MHGVQVSTDDLKTQIAEINPEVTVFENCPERLPDLPPDKWLNPTTTKPLRLFFGALNRKNDWKEWIDCLNDVLSRPENNWELEVIHDSIFQRSEYKA